MVEIFIVLSWAVIWGLVWLIPFMEKRNRNKASKAFTQNRVKYYQRCSRCKHESPVYDN